MRVALIAIVLFAADAARADDIVAILDLKFVQTTDLPAAVQCWGEEDDDCFVWATHNLYEASVRKRIHGDLPIKFRVLFGRHALAEKPIRGMIARLRKIECREADRSQCRPTDEYHAEYQVLEWGDKLDAYCFERLDGKADDVEIEGRHLKCFDRHPSRDD